MNYSRRQLEAFGEPLGESVTRLKPGGRIYGGGGGGGPTTTTVNQSNIPDWLRPQVETVLGGATKQLFQTQPVTTTDADGNETTSYEITGTKPFTPYSSDPRNYVAGFSPLQQQVQANVANLQVPDQYAMGTQMANAAAMGGAQTAQQALGYGNAGFQSGQLGQQLGIQGGGYYGGMGAGYGQQGAQLGIQGGQQYGGMGAGYGNMGAQIGMQGGQFYGGQGAGYGAGAVGMVPEAQRYGQTGANIGLMGLRAEELGRDITGQSRGYAGQQADIGSLYQSMATSPYMVNQFMSPYQQAVTDQQIAGAQRQADIAAQTRKAQAVRAGAYGGSRQAIENAEANRALATQMDSIRAKGLQDAYAQAQANILNRAKLGLEGLTGAQSGLNTALQGGNLGLQGIGSAMQGQQLGLSGLNAANSLYGTGIQGAGMGLQGVNAQLAGTAQGMQGAQIGLQGVDRMLAGTAQGMQGAQIGLQGVDRQLAGTAQGMQGAQVGLQGVTGAQAGYGLMNQSANTLNTLGNSQLGAQTGILGLQNQIGAQQQAQEQQVINQAIQNYAQAQEAPLTALQQYNALLRGYAVPGTTTSMYQAAPSLASQVTGLTTAGVGLAGLTKKKGGVIDSREGIDKLALRRALAGA